MKTRKILQDAVRLSGLGEEDIYLTFLLKCHPVRKHDKSKARLTCLNYLNQQIKAPRIKILVSMGSVILQTLFSQDYNLKEYHGHWRKLAGLPVMVTYHPLAAS